MEGLRTAPVMAQPDIAPQSVPNEGQTDGQMDTSSGWIVTVFDNDTNTFDEVVEVLIRATGCTLEEAEIETWEVDQLGRSVVHHGCETECRRSAEIICQIGIRVEVSQE